LTPTLQPILGSKSASFKQLAQDSAAADGKMAASIAQGDLVSQGPQRKLILRNCSACHGMQLPEVDKRLRNAFQSQRERLGIGNGFYQVGHDVRISSNDRKALQAACDALRAGALLVDACMP
jgi:hypothetical protein